MFLKDNQRGMNGSSRPTARASVTPCPPLHPTHPPTCLLQTISLPPGEAWEEVERQLGTNIATQAIALFSLIQNLAQNCPSREKYLVECTKANKKFKFRKNNQALD